MENLKNNVKVIITGANKGIGFELAKCFVRDWHSKLELSQTVPGLTLILSARNMQLLEAARAELITLSPHFSEANIR
jgi:NAD(P)-dependent dehydrogenase (short-subunit alcohol dehydrogenase family)